ncbi:MAG: hypothetical protein JXB49_30655 [Bacteroidales bacterium]|nr:hypothetical protein [Bacteroidales bacterium]
MKTINTILLVILFTFTFSLSTAFSQNDTMYIMKSGVIVGKYNVNTEVDSVIFYKPTIEDLTSGSLNDPRDSKVYQTVTIGNQVWMAENLAYLPSVVGPSTGSYTTPYYYVYGYDGTDVTAAKATANYNTYGVLYNWTAAMAGCPSGWHLPSDAEWDELVNYLADNGYNYDGTTGGGISKIAKSLASTSGWTSSSDSGVVGNTDYPSYRNKSGFTALPGGGRFSSGSFGCVGYGSYWWSATEVVTSKALIRFVLCEDDGESSHIDVKELGFSVRCLRD